MHTDLKLNLITNLSDNDSSISNESSASSSSSTATSGPSTSTNTEPELVNLTDHLRDLSLANEDLENLTENLFNDLVDHITLGLCFDMYKNCKMNSIKTLDNAQTMFANEGAKPVPPKNNKDNSNVDIYGHSLNGIRKLECACPSCHRNLAASRVATHLEKCMGMGRNSSRLASKRIALFIKNSNGTSSE